MNVILSDGVASYLQLYLFTCYRYESVVLVSNHFGRQGFYWSDSDGRASFSCESTVAFKE